MTESKTSETSDPSEIKPLTRKQWAELLDIAPGGLMPDRRIYDENDDTTLA